MNYFKTPLFIFTIIFLGLGNSSSQSVKTYSYEISYNDNYEYVLTHGTDNLTMSGASAFFQTRTFIPSRLVGLTFTPLRTVTISTKNWRKDTVTDSEFNHSTEIREIHGDYSLATYVSPYRQAGQDSIEVLLSFSVNIVYEPITSSGLRNPEATYESVLSKGNIYKIRVGRSGLYKIERSFLESDLGINLSQVDPRKIKIYGTRGGRLPEANNEPRTDDLVELHLFVSGESDGSFDASDYILFYAEGADRWHYSFDNRSYQFDKNIYDDFNYFFLKTEGDNGLRVTSEDQTTILPDTISDTYDFLQRLEEDKINLLGAFTQTHGSGKDWFGDAFVQGSRSRNYLSQFAFDDTDFSQPLHIEMVFVGRSSNAHSVRLSIGDQSVTGNIGSVSFAARDAGETTYARKVNVNSQISLSGPPSQLNVDMIDNITGSTGWLDYIQIVSKRFLKAPNTQRTFRLGATSSYATAAFRIQNYNNQMVWDITHPLHPRQIYIDNNLLSFETKGEVREFLMFNSVSDAFTPEAIGLIPAQNLHAIQDEDMIIVYHPDFRTQAEKLALHRQQSYGLKILLASTDEVYHEFSGGKADPTAIRDMARLLLYRNPEFSYLLLLGDASYDYKGLMKDINFENFVPTYQTRESLSPLSAFPTDDYYGLLGPDEGDNLNGALDIYVGRLPVRTAEEAENVVNKIIHYDSKDVQFGDWRLRTGYIADDGDNNLHVRDMDNIARSNETRQHLHNQEKVYIDAYKLLATSGEPRFPDANRAINDNIFKGQVAVTYLGHGGPLGWAQERILTVPDIQNMTNMDELTLLVTATCSFGSFDDPSLTSPAEHAILNPRGGAIALMTTSRVVFTNSNFQLTNSVHDVMFEKVDGHAPSFGHIMTFGKNKVPGINSRKFSLLGDPSQRIALPQYEIDVTHINGKDIGPVPDTLKALSQVTFSGIVSDEAGEKVSDFNGVLSATIFDKKARIQTLSNTSSSPTFSFDMYRNVIFKGAVTVVNGEWSLTFWVPKNIDYQYGKGRISLYATDGSTDAGGAFEDFVVGGTDENLIADNEGPRIEAFMNDINFVSGGITNENPVLLLHLSDDLGINVTGNAIGQDITATLDGDNKNIFILNDFYTSDKDDFTSGKVRFPLRKISPGQHFITARAWDISGNYTETRLDFLVWTNEDNSLQKVSNFPNPFSGETTFQFEHDLPDTELQIDVQIYSLSGNLVKNIREIKYSVGFRVNDMFWDGTNDAGSDVPRGIYLYKIIIYSEKLNQTRESGFKKLAKF